MLPLQNSLPGAIRRSSSGTGFHDVQLARALHKAANPILIIDRAGSIMWCNDAYTNLVDVPRERLARRKPSFLVPVRENGRFLSDLWAILMRGAIWKGELTERTESGRSIHVDAVMTPLDDALGNPAMFMVFLHDISEHKNRFDEVWKTAHHDHLTELPNRALFLSMLDHSIASSSRNGAKLALLFLDLDGFKKVNDSYGHDVGDLVLVEASRVLRTTVRRSDFVARLGGDEFVCLLSHIERESDAGDVASKIIQSIGAIRELDGKAVEIGCSVGVAVFPEDAADGAHLITASDQALYTAKRSGKNCWRRAEAGAAA